MLVLLVPDRQSNEDHKSTGLEASGIPAASEVYLDPELEL